MSAPMGAAGQLISATRPTSTKTSSATAVTSLAIATPSAITPTMAPSSPFLKACHCLYRSKARKADGSLDNIGPPRSIKFPNATRP
uniref:Uncharacterized protein n=1 Tax=Romanomermis culicivorax TaxID=13658 RepID=A0A915KIL2_ROMCU